MPFFFIIMTDYKKDICEVLLNAEKPSEYFEYLRLREDFPENFPELAALIGLEQNPKYHAVGDVWTHTMLVLNAAAGFRDKVQMVLPFMLSALCHDFGKAVASEKINGVIHSYEHEIKGLPLTENFLSRFNFEEDIIKYVLNMCRLHMKPNTIAVNNSSLKASNRMFSEALYPEDLIYLAAADCLGQIPQGDAEKNTAFLKERLNIYNSVMAEPFFGEAELREAGITEKEVLKETMEYANKLRLSNVKSEAAFKQALSYGRKLIKKMEKSLH